MGPGSIPKTKIKKTIPHKANRIGSGVFRGVGSLGSSRNIFPIIEKYVDQILLVDDQETVDAMRLIWERMKIIVEPSSAITLAAVLKNVQLFQGKHVGLILSGGNVDLATVAELFG